MIGAGIFLLIVGLIAVYIGNREPDGTIRTVGVIAVVVGIGLVLWDVLDVGDGDNDLDAVLLAPLWALRARLPFLT